MSMLNSLFGEIHWTPPDWLQRIGKRRFFIGLGVVVVLIAAAVGGYLYYESLPKPARVVARVSAPGLTPIVSGELRPAPVIIDFSVEPDPRAPVLTVDSVARIELVDKAVIEGISMEPAAPGEWRWESETRLVFKPAEDWPAGQEYMVRYAESIFAPNLILADDEVEFVTPDFKASLDELIFYQDPVVTSLRKVVATLSFTHPVDPESLDEHLRYSMREPGATIRDAAETVGREIEYDKHRRKAYVHSVPIEIPPQETYLTLHLSEDLAPAYGPSRFGQELIENVRIPDETSYFRVSSVQSIMTRNEDDEPEQALTFEFTDRVATAALQERVSGYVLPTELTLNGERVSNRRWTQAREVTPEVLAQAEKIEISLNAVQDDVAKMHSARLDLPEGAYLYVLIEEGLRSDGDFVMSRPYDTVVRAGTYPKEAKIAQSGAILPLTSSHRLTFVSRGVTTLKVELGRLLEDQVNHLASQTGGDIKSPYFNNYLFNEDNLTARTERLIDVNAGHPKESVYSSFDLSEFLPDGGYYFVTVQGWDRENKRPTGSQDKRFVLITDLGLLVKSNTGGTQDVFVHSIDSGLPVGGARISLLGKNGVPIMQRVTAADGHASLPTTDGFEREKAPTVYVVRLGADSVFMPYARSGRMLQYSRYDVGGERVRRGTDADRLKAQVFTDRGIYRPGDTAKFAAIVKSDDWQPLGTLPLVVNVSDPRGQTVMDKRIQLPDDGFLEEEFATELASPTGNYRATLYLVDEDDNRRTIGSEGFKVEEFLPDRLRIRSRISGQKTDGWIKPGDLVCEVSLENLFGTPAESRRVTGQLDVLPTAIRMRKHADYTFSDPLRISGTVVKSVTTPLTPTTTDQQGKAELPLPVRQYESGVYRLTVNTEGFEEGGGRSVKAQAGVMMSPHDYLIGHKTASDLSYLRKDSEHGIEYLAVNSDADSIALDGLTLSIVEETFVSTLVRRPNGTYAYQSILREVPSSSRDYEIAAGGSEFTLPTDRPGRFVVRITGKDGQVYSSVRFTVAGARNLAGNLERDAELDLIVDGTSFAPGDTIEMEITAPYTGTGLITIERDRVYAYKWFRSATNTSVQTIRVPDDVEGNAYINVAFVRDLDSPEVFVSPLSYAVAPFSINRDARTVEIELDLPELTRPGESLDIGYTASRDSRIVIYAVDEGILQVARYNVPDPLGFFLRKMALQVSTYQMVDLILPDFEAYVRSAAPGGGAGLEELAGANLNPFQRQTDVPVAFWSGIVEAGPEQRTVSYIVPDHFNGQLRVMAVAVSDAAVGSTSDTTLARAPFVITPNVLTAAAPGDEFDVNVGLANGWEGSGKNVEIELAVSPSEHLEIVGEASTQLQIDEGRESPAAFRVRALDRLGGASLAFTARSGTESSRRTATLSVRPSVAYVATIQAGTGNDDPLTLDYERSMYDQLAKQSAAASASPLILADGMLDYLDAFPHACAEQIVSKVFPQIGFLGNRDYTIDEAKIRQYFGDTVRKLRSRQTSEGGFRFWPTSPQAAQFPSVYIMHFFTDAKALGLSVPRDMLGSGIGFLQQIAARQVHTLVDARLRAYAIYVLTRNGTVTTNYLTNLHEYLEREHRDAWESDLAAAYMAASYELLKESRLADDLIGDYELGAGDEMTTDFDTRLGRDSQYLYLLARHFPDELDDIDVEKIRSLVAPVMRNRFNTLSSSYTILALGAYTDVVFGDGDGAMLSIAAGTQDAFTSLTQAARFARADVPNDMNRVRVHGSSGEDVYYVLSQTGFDRTPPAEARADGLEIFREYLTAGGRPVTEARIGDELTVRLRVRSTGRPRSNVAVVDMLPGGFEVQTDTVRNQYQDWHAEYKDIREDRVVIYGSFGDRMTEIRYRVKLTASGDFVLPSAFAGSMYDRNIQARTAPGRFIVRPLQ
jgi:uncharacterized protein YfaS (alpha-2-macroglobulin family)